MGKIFLALIIAGIGAYYYDLNSADTKIVKGKFSSFDTEHRCKQNHESMCKYYLIAKIGSGKNSKFHKFRVPMDYYHGKMADQIKTNPIPLVMKEKNIFPARLIGVEEKFQKKVDKGLAKELEAEGKASEENRKAKSGSH